eukprot:m.846402 g.846402  ORF g.846402 m.846402 type:complete len:50 (+) comp23477_c1_seq96:5401-5550(+)
MVHKHSGTSYPDQVLGTSDQDQSTSTLTTSTTMQSYLQKHLTVLIDERE